MVRLTSEPIDYLTLTEQVRRPDCGGVVLFLDRKSTRLNSSHANISYAVFCLKKKLAVTPRPSIAVFSFSATSLPTACVTPHPAAHASSASSHPPYYTIGNITRPAYALLLTCD